MGRGARRTLRVRLTVAAGAALIAFAGVWALNLSADQCGNADSVECSPLGYLLLDGLLATALLTAALVAAAVAMWLARGLRLARQRAAR